MQLVYIFRSSKQWPILCPNHTAKIAEIVLISYFQDKLSLIIFYRIEFLKTVPIFLQNKNNYL